MSRESKTFTLRYAGPTEEDALFPFHQKMANRMAVSDFKYGPVRDKFPHQLQAIKQLELYLAKYLETHNIDVLADIANFAGMEALYPSFADAHDYIAGPMKGYPDLNQSAFSEARERLRALGHDVRCPAEYNTVQDIAHEDVLDDTSTAFACFRWDVQAVLWADVVVVLADWLASAGAMLETQIAAAIGTPVSEWPAMSTVQWAKRPAGATVLPRRIPISKDGVSMALGADHRFAARNTA